jgi:hypothetical protein
MISSILNAFAQVSAPVAELLTHHSAVFQPRATSMATDPSPPRSLLAPPLVQYNSHRRSRLRIPENSAGDSRANRPLIPEQSGRCRSEATLEFFH